MGKYCVWLIFMIKCSKRGFMQKKEDIIMKQKIKQILSFMLVCVMALGILPAKVMTEVRAETVGTTDLFNGHATYLLEERFNGAMNNTFGKDTIATLSGWDVDNRGGRVYKYGDDLIIADSNGFESITMDHKLMKHTGDGLVFETAFKYDTYVTDGFYYEILGDSKKSLRLFVEGGYICLQKAGSTKTKLMQCSANTFYHIKAEFTNSTKKVQLWINGQSMGTYAYLEDAVSIDEVKLGTEKDQVGQLVLDFVNVYVNYIVNEKFMSAPAGKIPVWMTATGGSIKAVPGAPYPADPNGYSLPKSKSFIMSHDTVTVSEKGEKYSFVWEMLIPSGGADGFKFANGVDFEVKNGAFYVDSEPVYEYTKNVWYKIELQISYEFVDVYINNVKRATCTNYLEDFTELEFTNGSASTILLDNIAVYKTFDAQDFEDYPTVDENPESDINIGMIVYPMWREGIHYGWDLISPYEERTPYLGYYTGGSREVADWDNKWLLEHGFDHAVFPFARPDITTAGGQPSFSVRGEALHDGYMNSLYKDQLDFAIMLTNPLNESYDSAAEFISNVEPYLVEHYFKNPSYKSVNNRLLVYNYNPKGFSDHLGGDDQLIAVLESLNTAAKNIDNQNGGKYDGITFICDISSGNGLTMFETLSSGCSFGSYIYKWRYTWGSDKYTNIVNGIKTDYASDNSTVASIPMGFDNTPWLYNEVGIISPDGVQEMCNAVVNNKTASDPNIIVLTCWDEWGEGHFFAPSNIHGFDYLNAVRKTFTTSGEKTDEDRPTEDALRRMDVLYPENRQILKIKKDRVETTADDIAKLTSLGKISVKGTRGSNSGCDYSRTGNFLSGYTYTYTVTSSPATITYSSGLSKLNIDASKITAVRIKGYAENSSTMVLYLRNSDKDYDTKPLIRLEGKCDGGTNVIDTILYPTDPENFTGTVTGMRFNPAAGTSNGSEIYIEEVEFYTGKVRTTVTVDDEEIDLVSPVEIPENGPAYLPAYKLLLDLGAYAVWDKPTKTLTVEKDNVTIKITADNPKVDVNGVEKTLSYAPYYKEGNLFIPYSGILEEFGYSTKHDVANRNICIYSKTYEDLKNYVNTNVWDFNIDGFTEGWSGSGVLTPMTVQNGMLQLFAKTQDPILNITELDIPISKARYAIVRIKKTDSSETGMLRLYDDSTSASGVVYKFNLTPSEKVQEFVFDMATDATVSSSYTNKFEDLTKITRIRLDPMDNYGGIFIDHISIVETLPEKAGIKAYGFEKTNMLQLDTEKTGFTYTNTLNSEGNTTGNVLPATETVDGYSNVIKVVPVSGKNEGIFTIDQVYYDGSKQKVDEVCADNRVVKVSFWYKGLGNCTALRFESRQGGSRDGEEFQINDVSNSEWKYFEGYIDMSNETASGRWFSLRVTTGGTTAQDGIYLRDYKLVCLDETTTINAAGDTIAISLNDFSDDPRAEGADVYIAEYDADENLIGATLNDYPNKINVLTNGATKTENAKYYYVKPSADTVEIKCFFWKDLAPITEEFAITTY